MDLNLANNIKELRKSLNITQSELARMLSVTPQSVSRWEKSQTYPDLVMLPKLAEFFGVTLDELMLGTETTLSLYRKELSQAIEELKDEDTYGKRLRICDLYDILCREQAGGVIVKYLHFLFDTKRLYSEFPESKVDEVRKKAVYVLKEMDPTLRSATLCQIISHEDEEKLDFWRDFVPVGIERSTWEDYLTERYSSLNDIKRLEKTTQKACLDNIKKALMLFVRDVQLADEGQPKFTPASSKRFKAALEFLNSISDNPNDIFLPLRTGLEFGLARALFYEGQNEQGFVHLNSTKEHMASLWKLRRDGASVTGSEFFPSVSRN